MICIMSSVVGIEHVKEYNSEKPYRNQQIVKCDGNVVMVLLD